jgi:hypothetical protein
VEQGIALNLQMGEITNNYVLDLIKSFLSEIGYRSSYDPVAIISLIVKNPE